MPSRLLKHLRCVLWVASTGLVAITSSAADLAAPVAPSSLNAPAGVGVSAASPSPRPVPSVAPLAPGSLGVASAAGLKPAVQPPEGVAPAAPAVTQPVLPAAPPPVWQPPAPPVTPSPPPVATPLVSATSAASATASVVTSAAPASSAGEEGAEGPKPVAVKVGDDEVFTLRVGTKRELENRARAAGKALTTAIERTSDEVRVRAEGSNWVLYVGAAPVVELSAADAEAAGVASLEVYAAQVATGARQALEAERYRKRVGNNAFYGSLVVFLGLIAFFLMRKVNDLAQSLRLWLESNTEELSVRVRSIELVRPEMLQSFALVGVGISRWLSQLGIVYLWLITVLSFFEATRGYTERLTGLVVAPVSQLTQRLATALPLVFVVGLGVLAVMALVRFVDLLFASVARRETTIAFVPADLAPATSVLLRFGIVVGALVFAAPVITGDPDGAFARIGIVGLVAFGLASTPIVATVLMGSAVLFGRRLKVGEYLEIGTIRGRVLAINLLELRLETAYGTEVRVPHLLMLRQPLSKLGVLPRVNIQVAISAQVSPLKARQELAEAAAGVGADIQVELLSVSEAGLLFRVGARCASLQQRSELTTAVAERLIAVGMPLGRADQAASGYKDL